MLTIKVGARIRVSKERKKGISRWVPCRPDSKGVELAGSVAFVLQANFQREKTLEKKTLKLTPWHQLPRSQKISPFQQAEHLTQVCMAHKSKVYNKQIFLKVLFLNDPKNMTSRKIPKH